LLDDLILWDSHELEGELFETVDGGYTDVGSRMQAELNVEIV
jgi:hypothetical protein